MSLNNILVSNWRDAWKWLSVQFSTFLIIWATLPADMQNAILGLFGLDQSKLMGLMGVIIILGRLKQQGTANG